MTCNIGKGRGGKEVRGREASEEGGADIQRRRDGSLILEHGNREGRLSYSAPQRGRALRQNSEEGQKGVIGGLKTAEQCTLTRCASSR